jgi:hypothetical protein
MPVPGCPTAGRPMLIGARPRARHKCCKTSSERTTLHLVDRLTTATSPHCVGSSTSMLGKLHHCLQHNTLCDRAHAGNGLSDGAVPAADRYVV